MIHFFLLIMPVPISSCVHKAHNIYSGWTSVSINKACHDITVKCTRTFDCLKAESRLYKRATSPHDDKDIKRRWGRVYFIKKKKKNDQQKPNPNTTPEYTCSEMIA